MSTFSPQRPILHRLDYLAEVSHRGDQLRLLGSLAPSAGHGKHFELALYALASVSFGFQNVERHTDIPAYHVALGVQRQRCEHIHTDTCIKSSPSKKVFASHHSISLSHMPPQNVFFNGLQDSSRIKGLSTATHV
jgi:hypothetical protein